MHRFALRGIFASALAAAVVAAGTTRAQVVELAPDEPAAGSAHFRFHLGYDHRFDADIDGSNGDFGVDSVRGSAGYWFELADGLSWDNYASYRFSDYDFSAPAPWDDVHSALWASRLRFAAGDQWSFYGGPLLGFEGESGSDFGDGFVGGGMLGFAWSPGPDLRLGLGFGVLSQIEDDVRFLVVPTVDWRFADAWRLRTGILELGAATGLGGEIGWQLAPRVEWAFGAQFQRRRWRLDGGASNPDGVGQDRSLPVYAKLVWEAAGPVALEFVGGVHFAGELRVESSRGTKLAERDYDPQGFLGLRARFRF
jgi:hypothetical protein